MTTPLTTAEIVERLRKGIQQRQKHILDGDGNAIGLAGYTFDVDGTDTLMSEAATVIETLERVMEYMRHWEARAEAAEAELAKVREVIDKYRDATTKCLSDGGVLASDPDATEWWNDLVEAQQFAATVHPPRARAALSEKTV